MTNTSNMEKLIEKLKELIAKEEDYLVKTGLRMALLEAMTSYADILNQEIKESIKKYN